MAFASIFGVVYDVLTQGAGENTPEKSGLRRRTWNMGIRSGEKVQKRSWTLPLAPITEAQFQTLYAATALSTQGAVVGDFTNGVSKTCVVDIVSAAYFKPNAAGPLYRSVVLNILEA